MILTKSEILKHQENGDIIISPFRLEQLNPNSYNLRLGPVLKTYKDPILDCKKEGILDVTPIDEKEGILLVPNKLYLGSTLEWTKTNNLVPMIEGRSSLARLGINVHISAGFGDIGFEGKWTLEISVIEPVKIYRYIEACQIYYVQPTGEIIETYNGKYQGAKTVEGSKMYEEFKCFT